MEAVSTVWLASRPSLRLVMLTIAVLLSIGPALAQAQDATPAAEANPGALAAMVSHVPTTLPGLDDPSAVSIVYADLAAQLDAVGMTPPTGPDAEGMAAWQAATRVLPLPTSASPFGVYTREDYGFDLLQADRTLAISLPPFHLTLLQGRFDRPAIEQALEVAGYRPVEVGGHTLLALRGDFEQDLAAPRAFQMSNMNYAAILDDGTLAFASAGDPLAAVLDVDAGTQPSMLEAAGVGLLLDQAPPDIASAMFAPGTALASGIPEGMIEPARAGGTPDISAIATEIAGTSEMPPIVLALLVTTVGGPLTMDDEPLPLPPGTPTARAGVVALMLTPEAAHAAVPIVEERLATGQSASAEQPYTALFPKSTVVAPDGMPVLRVDLTLGQDVSPRILENLLFARDLGFLGW